jgi:hypothetical protein
MSKELKEALRLINKVLVDPRVDPGHRDQLQKARRELEAFGRAGKLDRRKLSLAVQHVATVLLDLVDVNATRRP